LIFRNPSYQSISGNVEGCADVLMTTALTPSADIYGVSNFCTWSNDVFSTNAAIPRRRSGRATRTWD
jgi:hypothetical protein